MEDVVFVLGFDKNTKLIKASMSCDATQGPHYASYYRSIGYSARIVYPENLQYYLNRDKERREEQKRLMREELGHD